MIHVQAFSMHVALAQTLCFKRANQKTGMKHFCVALLLLLYNQYLITSLTLPSQNA